MSSNKEFDSIAFDLPKNQSNVIKVIGVGGGGSNAIDHMFEQGIKGVDFYICNTDAQALQNSGVPNKIQLGLNLTEGLGAGANPDIGEQSAVESIDDISQMLDTNTKMVFITAGMGGGTGTGAAPIIAKMAKDKDILTVAIVTIPFQFEGKMRLEQSKKGVDRLRDVVDSLIVINNNKLRDVYGNLGFKAGFSKADEVLSTAAKGIAEVITHHYTQNIDLRDAKTVLSNSGTAIMGSALASGKNRAQDAIGMALDSPLLNDNKITGAKNVLLLIVSGSDEITLDEIGEINEHIQNEAGHGANIIMGIGEDEALEESIAVTIIATGFNIEQQDEISNTETKRKIHILDEDHGQNIDVSKPGYRHPLVEDKKEETPLVKHTLDLNEDDSNTNEYKPSIGNKIALAESVEEHSLIETTEDIRNIDVVYDEVDLDLDDEDFVINSVPKNIEYIEEESNTEEEEKQITLTFDMPISSQNKKEEEVVSSSDIISYDLEDEKVAEDLNDIKVNEHIELISVNEFSKEGDIRYVLEDFNESENAQSSKTKQEDPKDALENFDQDVVFEKKEIAPESEIENVSNFKEEVDPLTSPISELLKERAEERRRKMKDFNYKFNNAKIDDIEKVPAYKRQGVNLNEVQHSSETDMSRTSVSSDENNDIQLRSNNSFLHDNVD